MSFDLRNASVTNYLSALSERTPTPGGGAVAGYRDVVSVGRHAGVDFAGPAVDAT